MPGYDPSSAADWLARRRRLDSLLRLQAAVMIGDPGHDESVRLLAEAIRDPEPEIRELAAAALCEFGPEAEHAVPNLIQALQDENAVVRRRAARALGMIGTPSVEDALSNLIAATEDEDDSVSLQAIATLGELGSAAAAAVPALVSAIWTGDIRRRAIAGVALTRIGPPAVPSLIQSLSHPALDVRAKIASLLGRIGPGAAEAVDALKELVNDHDEHLRTEAAAALQAINGAC